MFFSDMSVKEAGFRPVMVEGELPDKATEKKKAQKSATEIFYLKGSKGFVSRLCYGKTLPKRKD